MQVSLRTGVKHGSNWLCPWPGTAPKPGAAHSPLAVHGAGRAGNSSALFGWTFCLSVCLEIFILVLILDALALFWQRQVFLPSVINVRRVLHLKECRPSLLEARCSRTGRWMIHRDVSVHDFPQKSRKRLPRENVSTRGELNPSSGYPCNSSRIFKVQSSRSKGSYASAYCFYKSL